MAMNTPVHPGAIVREDCLRPLGLSVTEGARCLGIGRQTLSNLVNERASVSIEMAYRLSKAFGSTPETWLGMQMAFDLARSRHLESTIQCRTNCCRVGHSHRPLVAQGLMTRGFTNSVDGLRLSLPVRNQAGRWRDHVHVPNPTTACAALNHHPRFSLCAVESLTELNARNPTPR